VCLCGDAIVRRRRVASDEDFPAHPLDERHRTAGDSTSRPIEGDSHECRVDCIDEVPCRYVTSILAIEDYCLFAAPEIVSDDFCSFPATATLCKEPCEQDRVTVGEHLRTVPHP
jgi:hypothetical protein